MKHSSPELDQLATSHLGRDRVLLRIEEDLVGPRSVDEQLNELPSDRYLTGMLFPPSTLISPEEDEELGQGGEDEEETPGDGKEQVRLSGMQRPASAGLSFSVETQGRPELRIHVRCGTYLAYHYEGEDDVDQQLVPGKARRLHDSIWVRSDHDFFVESGPLDESYGQISAGNEAPESLELHYQVATQTTGPSMVTVAVVNANEISEHSRDVTEEATFFQVSMEITGSGSCRLVPRPSRRTTQDEDDEISALIYREARQYAVGHTCSAGWPESTEEQLRVFTTWIPTQVVPAMSAEGGEVFHSLHEGLSRPLSAGWLSGTEEQDMLDGLRQIPELYLAWLKGQEQRIPGIEASLHGRANKQIETCRRAAERMHASIRFLAENPDALRAFRLANQAMLRSRVWGTGEKDAELNWRPFQLGFQLLALESVGNRDHPERGLMDLLWFPTGGGKTEAYLGLTAFLLFYRRLLEEKDPDRGAGTALIMRYTLRALTVQQFQRAATLVMACESVRLEEDDSRFGTIPFSIGLWVGGSATPNKVKDAVNAEGSDSTHKQLSECPCCKKQLKWRANAKRDKMEVRCRNKSCDLGRHGKPLPIWTIDEDIYREVPAVVIGTVDKFAQLTRNESVVKFFGNDGAYAPPDVILQDELHLISGPLGTIAGLYEIAIDHLCSQAGHKPKIIGSTATIRHAEDQVLHLFNRTTSQFPPPVLDHDDSCFATVDRESHGRRYAAVTTAGRSPKFTLQAVSASLLQSIKDPSLTDAELDHYSTMLVYFNSLRELGGALILMQDDVNATIEAYSGRRSEPQRELDAPEELTSRKSAAEIRELLDDLGSGDTSPEVLLASNMISVGVDIERLGLMVVNGQPKTVAEYIQSTSRVGRGATPGLVLGIYNNGRVRDRSHYETFKTWHSSLYREVEATSVTPFASRAIDKALHAVLVALGRHQVPGLRASPTMSAESREAMLAQKQVILDRVRDLDPSEQDRVAEAVDRLLDEWVRRSPLEEYWVDHGSKTGLLISAEQYAALNASGHMHDERWPTPNSMRDVEPTVAFQLGFPPRREVSAGTEKESKS